MATNTIANENFIAYYLFLYLDHIQESSLEYEIRFGTKRDYDKITKTSFDNVIKQLKTSGFQIKPVGHYLRVFQNNYKNTRVEIEGLHHIQKYCKYENIDNFFETYPNNINLVEKKPHIVDNNEILPKDYDDFMFRVSLQEEKNINVIDTNIDFSEWKQLPKTYRLLNRIRATHPKYSGLSIDLTIVKQSMKKKTNNIQESNVFQSSENYEIEIEYNIPDCDKEKLKDLNEKQLQLFSLKKSSQIKTVITEILRGLQNTMFPLPVKKYNEIYNEYFKLSGVDLNAMKKHNFIMKPTSKQFIGPSMISLERKHLHDNEENNVSPTIFSNYTITEKADGIRKMLFIAKDGKCYFITYNMEIQYTGMELSDKDKALFTSSLYDGEYVSHDKNGLYINLFMIFDVYMKNGKDLRPYTFIQNITNNATEEDKDKMNPFEKESRMQYMIELNNIHLENKFNITPLRIRSKTFYLARDKSEMFSKMKQVTDNIDNNIFEYETDGVIFTPAYTGVGIRIGGKPFNTNRTWNETFKWKPSEFNSIDFVAIIQKNKNGSDKIQYTNSQVQLNSNNEITTYKTLLLHVGKNVYEKHTPCFQVLYGTNKTQHPKNTFRPVPFEPSNPSDEHAKFCNMEMKDGQLIAENGEVIQDKVVIECRYDPTRQNGWKWIPMRIRHDKTAEFRANLKFGNAYHVANSVWNSIHYPVTLNMLTGKENIENISENAEVYYNQSTLNHTKALRDFHNLFVKSKLITGASKPFGTLLDLSVGKGGDISKWVRAKLRFVLGIDISPDNINNEQDGVCKRYLNIKNNRKAIFDGLFIHGDSSKNIKNGEGIFSEQHKQFIQIIYDNHKKSNSDTIPNVVQKYENTGKEGFDVVSCQFAMHYFFETKQSLHQFIRNIAEGCALGGHFISTTFDGNTVFSKLQSLKKGETQSIFHNDKLVWEITKQYEKDEFTDDESCIGLGIDVYQESINKTFREYLVHPDYFIQLMRTYGFEIITKNEAEQMQLPQGTDSFKHLFEFMKQTQTNSLKTNMNIGDAIQLANDNNTYQRTISFLNRYYIFKKVLDVNIQEVYLKHTQPNVAVNLNTDAEPITGNNNLPSKLEKTNNNNSILTLEKRKNKTYLYDIISSFRANTIVYKRLVSSLRRIEYSIPNFKANDFILYVRKQVMSSDLPKTDYEYYSSFKPQYDDLTIIEQENNNDKAIVKQNKGSQIDKKLKSLKIKTTKPTTYLDFGCGDGKFTKEIMEHYKILKTNTYGVDKKKYPSIDDMGIRFLESNIPNVTSESTDTSKQFRFKLPIEDNTIDIVTVFMVLHHIPKQYHENVIKELYRIISPNGVLILKEHNAPSVNEKDYEPFYKTIDIVHDVYDFIIEPELSWMDSGYYSKYLSLNQWDMLFKQSGFDSHMKPRDYKKNIHTNPTHSYISVYQKTKTT